MSKKTADNKEIPDRIWYYLLDFIDQDKLDYDGQNIIQFLYSKDSLKELTKSQVLNLLAVATDSDIRNNK